MSLRVCLWPKDIAGISLPMSTGAMLAAGRTEVGDRQVADILFDFRSAELQKSLFGLWTFCRRNSLDISKVNFPRTVSVVQMTTCPPASQTFPVSSQFRLRKPDFPRQERTFSPTTAAV